MKILIIEDKKALAEVLADKLRRENYIVDVVNDGDEGFYTASTGVYDLIILDVMLPGMDGFSILKELRSNKIDSKIIMLTAKSTLKNKLEGFQKGANDYLTKPFHVDELLARVKIQLQDKFDSNNLSLMTFGDIELNTLNSQITCTTTKESVELVCKELQILEYLINNKNQILSREQFYDKVWGVYNEYESNNLEVYFTFLRRKLKAIGSQVNIKAVRGLGYKLEIKDEKVKN